MSTVEASVRSAAAAFLSASVSHSETFVLNVANDDLVRNPEGFGSGGDAKIISVLVLHKENTAVAHVQWADERAGWLTLLLDKGEWMVISCVSSATKGSSTPEDMAGAVKACWEEYCGSNRACDGPRMAQVFHPLCRLTYTGPDGSLVLKPQDVFVQMVSERYSTPMHSPYAHLQGDPRVAALDSLLSVSFATSDVCMVVLKVGHPPMLCTDVLTCARLAGGRWWIVAKSSCSEPLLADEAK